MAVVVVELIELRCATRAMVGRARAAEEAARARATQTPGEAGAAGLYGDLQRLREMAQEAAAAVTRLAAELDL
jgi:hypothetical protein